MSNTNPNTRFNPVYWLTLLGPFALAAAGAFFYKKHRVWGGALGFGTGVAINWTRGLLISHQSQAAIATHEQCLATFCQQNPHLCTTRTDSFPDGTSRTYSYPNAGVTTPC